MHTCAHAEKCVCDTQEIHGHVPTLVHKPMQHNVLTMHTDINIHAYMHPGAHKQATHRYSVIVCIASHTHVLTNMYPSQRVYPPMCSHTRLNSHAHRHTHTHIPCALQPPRAVSLSCHQLFLQHQGPSWWKLGVSSPWGLPTIQQVSCGAPSPSQAGPLTCPWWGSLGETQTDPAGRKQPDPWVGSFWLETCGR